MRLEPLDPEVLHTTDDSTVDYQLQTEGDLATIDAHFEAEPFTDVEAVTYVVDSDVRAQWADR